MMVNWSNCSIIVSILIPNQWAFSSLPWTNGVNLLILKLTALKHSHFIQHNYNLIFPLFSATIHWTPSKCTQQICISMFSSLFIAKLWNVQFPVGLNIWHAESHPLPSWSHTFLETFPVMGKKQKWATMEKSKETYGQTRGINSSQKQFTCFYKMFSVSNTFLGLTLWNW